MYSRLLLQSCLRLPRCRRGLSPAALCSTPPRLRSSLPSFIQLLPSEPHGGRRLCSGAESFSPTCLRSSCPFLFRLLYEQLGTRLSGWLSRRWLFRSRRIRWRRLGRRRLRWRRLRWRWTRALTYAPRRHVRPSRMALRHAKLRTRLGRSGTRVYLLWTGPVTAHCSPTPWFAKS
jgi:hypothetical protein